MSRKVLAPATGAFLMCVAATIEAGAPGPVTDPRDAGLSTVWLVFGFAAQAVFGLRFLIQWIASERAKESVVPPGFWVLSLVGGVALFFYFLRRGDPVGMVGQLFGVLVYSRNLYLLEQKRRRSAAMPAVTPAVTPGPTPGARPAAVEEPIAHG